MIKQHNPEPRSTAQVPRWLLSQLETDLYQGGVPTSRAAVVEALEALPGGVVGPLLLFVALFAWLGTVLVVDLLPVRALHDDTRNRLFTNAKLDNRAPLDLRRQVVGASASNVSWVTGRRLRWVAGLLGIARVNPPRRSRGRL